MQFFCESSIFGKQTKLSFPKHVQFWTSQMFVHFDIKGPLDPTFIGFQYFVTFTDGFSRYTMIYFIKQKSQTFSKFKAYRPKLKIFKVIRLIFLWSDNEGKYV
jgi:hypothetical protein